MNTILHLSDFHINAKMPDPENNEVFRNMIIKVKEQNLENLTIVYTGDIIDNAYITVPDGLSEIEKKTAWEKGATDAFSKAAKYFKYLTQELHIDNKHIIIAIGNHDINQHDVENVSFECHIEKIETIEYGKDRFKCIKKFIDDMNYQYFESDNHFRKVDCFNFIIANAQWVDKHNPKTQLLCLNCKSLNKVFNEYRNALVNTKENLGKIYNIFVAHNPERDCCEYSCFEWPENNFTCLEKKVVEFCGIKLFGDKHTNSIYKQDYIVGAPLLNSDSITYGIHYFNNNVYAHKIMSYSKKNNNWCVRVVPESIKEILNYSFYYLKDLTFDYLKIEHEINTIVTKIYNFHKVKMEDSWNNLDELFSSFVKLQKPVNEQPGDNVDFSNGLFECVTSLVRRSHNLFCLTIKGGAETGKSTFLSALYLNLLYEYSIGLFPYIPAYINIEKLLDQCITDKDNNSESVVDFCIDNTTFLEEIREKIEGFFYEISKYSKEHNSKFSIIIDGIKQFKFFENFDLDNSINTLLLKYKESKELQTSIICIDTDKALNLEVSIFDRKRDSEYISYFDSIYSYNVKSRQRLERFVRSYCLLNNYGAGLDRNVLESIKNLRIPWVDLNLLTIAGNQLVARTNQPVFEILYHYYRNLLSVFPGHTETERNLPARVSFKLYFENLNYTAIKRTEYLLGYRLFNKITRHSRLSKILIAKHYYNHIKKVTNKKGRLSDNSNRVFNRLYDYEICSFITGYLKLANVGLRLKEFENKYYKALGFSGRSTLTYLIGRIIDDKNEIKQILDKEENILEKERIDRNEEATYYEYRIARRSVYISRIANNIENFLSRGKYFDKLISDDYERRINRKFYLQFYGDRNELQIEPQHDVILQGLDFYYTYQLLASRMEEWRSNGRRTKVFDLELFTLCDLIQIHLDIPNVTHNKDGRNIFPYNRNETKPSSFFYNDRYLDPTRNSAKLLLELMIDIIDRYIPEINSEYRKYKQYLHIRKNEFENAIDAINNKRPIATFRSSSVLDKFSKLAQVKRIGWHIDDGSVSIDDNILNEIKGMSECFETTLEHVYECLLIGLFYLPNHIDTNNSYDKTTILKMLLIHDLGEAEIGDYPPSYVHYLDTRDEEDIVNVRTFFSGTHEGIADLTEYLNLWNGWFRLKKRSDSSDINIKIAADIDKIQMIYKLLCLLSKGRISLPQKRVEELYGTKSGIITTEGKKIFNELIANNSEFQKKEFQEKAKNLGISINEI